jgi:hypothetical protein
VTRTFIPGQSVVKLADCVALVAVAEALLHAVHSAVMRKPPRCICAAELDLLDVSRGERAESQCPRCGLWWSATGWHPIAPPKAAGKGPWFAIRSWPDPKVGPYLLRYWYEVVGGRPALVGAELWGRAPVESPWPLEDLAPMPVTPLRAEATRLATPELLEGLVQHNVNLRQALKRAWDEGALADAAVTAELARQRGLDATDPGTDAATRFGKQLALDEAAEKTGRPRTADIAQLKEVAEIMRRAMGEGFSYVKVIQAHFARQGRPVPADSTVRGWKRRAVKSGDLVEPSTQGKEGGTDASR